MGKQPPIPLYPETKPDKASGVSFRAIAIWIGLAAFLAVLTFAGVYWVRLNLAVSEFSSDTSRRQIIVGGELLNIPENMIRFKEQRKAVTLSRIDLILHWPSGEGYSQARRLEFEDTSDNQKLIFLTLGNRKMRHSMSERLTPIYRKLFHGKARAGPSGLKLQSLKRGAGYDGEELALARDGELVWVARCQLETFPTPPTCLRDIHVGKRLSARFRFPRKMLADWRGVEKLIQERFRVFSTR